MGIRDEQREQTRARIIDAALAEFAARGFDGAATRDIARRAGIQQGLLTYHFPTKDELWRATADQVFAAMRASLRAHLAAQDLDDPREVAREMIREYVRLNARHPERYGFMVGHANVAGDRLTWLVDTHLRPLFEGLTHLRAITGLPPGDVPLFHFFYMLAGAGTLIFAVAEECEALSGVDPRAPDVVERHAELVARMLLP